MTMEFWIDVVLYCIYEVLAQHWYEGGDAIFGLMLRRNTFNWHLDCCYKPSGKKEKKKKKSQLDFYHLFEKFSRRWKSKW